MSVLASGLDPAAPEFAANRTAMLARLAELDAEHARAIAGGGGRYVERHHARGKLLPRERIELLLDQDSPFLELSPLAAWGTEFPVGASTVTGVGVVSGVECVVVANDPTVRGGTSNPWTLRKTLRAMEVAAMNRRWRLRPRYERPHRDDRRTVQGVPGRAAAGEDGDGRGRRRREPRRRRHARPHLRPGRPLCARRARRHRDRPPHRPAAQPPQARDRARAGGRCAAPRPRGPARARPARPAGAVRSARGNRPRRRRLGLRRVQAAVRHEPGDRVGPRARLSGGPSGQRPRGAVLPRGAQGHPVHPVGEPHRYPPGVPAQHDRLHGRAGVRAGRHHQGGRPDDQRGGQQRGAARVGPARRVHGAGHYGMCGRAFDPRFLFAWPSAKAAAMGPAQLAGVLSLVARQSTAAARRPFDEDADLAMRAAVEGQIEAESLPMFFSGRLFDDGVIDPRDTRTVLGLCLSAIHSAPVEGTAAFGVFRP